MSKQNGCVRPLQPATFVRHTEGGEHMNMSMIDPMCRAFAQCVVDPIWGVCRCSYTLKRNIHRSTSPPFQSR